MSGGDLAAILPLIVLAVASVLLLLLIAVRRQHRLCAAATAVALVIALGAVAPAGSWAPRQVTSLLLIDGYALFYMALIITSALAVTLLAYGYFEARSRELREEFYVLLLLATLGAAVVVASSHFAAFFLGLETLSISLLALIAYPRSFQLPLEAGLKYLILSGVASSFLLFGVALVYTELGTLSFVANDLRHGGVGAHLFWVAGLAMILTGIGFKLSLVPFHMWAPDVYEGAPAPVSGFVAVVSKTAVAALLLRYAQATGFLHTPSLNLALSIIAIASIIVGNLLALLQTNVKRILAYSSIAHFGYVLVAMLAGGALALEAVSAYLVAYAITMLGAFGVVTLLSDTEGQHDTDQIDDYHGLLWSRPIPAVIFAAMLLSLAGIPLTAGFIAKFYVLNAGVGASLVAPVAAVVIGSIIGLYYYLRIIVAMAARPPLGREAVVVHRLGSFVVAVLAVLLIVVGVYPAPLISTIRATAVALAAFPATPAAQRGPVAIGLER